MFELPDSYTHPEMALRSTRPLMMPPLGVRGFTPPPHPHTEFVCLKVPTALPFRGPWSPPPCHRSKHYLDPLKYSSSSSECLALTPIRPLVVVKCTWLSPTSFMRARFTKHSIDEFKSLVNSCETMPDFLRGGGGGEIHQPSLIFTGRFLLVFVSLKV